MRELRKRKDLTIRAVSDAIGVTEGTVRNWEKGRTKPRLSLNQFLELCGLLGCQPTELVKAIEVSQK